MPVLDTCKFCEDPVKNDWEKVDTVLNQSAPKLMRPFPHLNDATYKIWPRLAKWS